MEGKTAVYARLIVKALEDGTISTREELNRRKLALGKQLGMKELPSNPDILAHSGKGHGKISKMLSIKPLRTLSGVAPVAIMTKPISCPHGTCIYCPGGPKSFFGNVPQSYTGNEPATMRAINNNYDAYLQTMNRLSQYYSTGHFPEKIELIIMGGTFPSFPENYQEEFIAGAFRAANDFSRMFFTNEKFDPAKFNGFFHSSRTVARAGTTQMRLPEKNNIADVAGEHLKNEKARARIVTMCVETKPDWCRETHINRMLELGTTRVELGAQSIYDEVLAYTNRGHTARDTIEATRLLKDSGLKVTYHMMLGQPKSSMEKDIAMFRELFDNSDYRPDGLKIYPCMVMPGTALAGLFEKGKFTPLTTEEAVEIISEANRHFPEYCRVHRVQRDIPTKLSLGGVDRNNLRQIVEEKMREKGIRTRDIREREAGIRASKGGKADYSNAELCELHYAASRGKEVFISFEDRTNDIVLGFCRLRMPHEPFRKEFDGETACIRELHVFGSEVGIGAKKEESTQHRGFGKRLVEHAERVAREKFGAQKMLVISGVGAREYYSEKLGYTRRGAYMSKRLGTK